MNSAWAHDTECGAPCLRCGKGSCPYMGIACNIKDHYCDACLLDALGTTINSVGAKLAAMEEDERPSKVIFLVITDGEENSSREFTKEQIKSMVEHQQDVYKWQFVFMGANIDSMAEGTSIGIAQNNTMDYEATFKGIRGLYTDVSHSLTRYRTHGPSKSGFFGK